MSSTTIEEQLHRVITLYQEANDEFEKKLAASGFEIAAEWGHHVREAFARVEPLGLLLAKVYASPADDAKARKEFVEHAIKDFGSVWFEHLSHLYKLVLAKYPEPPEPGDDDVS